MIHQLIRMWFENILDWGYWGLGFLMALESTIVPIPSEVIIPPAAFWASQGKFDFTWVVVVSTLGAYFGSVASYAVSLWVGRPFVMRYGKYVGFKPQKLEAAEAWLKDYSSAGIFFARLLPVMRHLISIPAGVMRVSFWSFSLSTFLGALSWSWVLAYFGQKIIGDSPDILQDPEALGRVIKVKMIWIILGIVAFGAAHFFITFWMKRQKKSTILSKPSQSSEEKVH